MKTRILYGKIILTRILYGKKTQNSYSLRKKNSKLVFSTAKGRILYGNVFQKIIF